MRGVLTRSRGSNGSLKWVVVYEEENGSGKQINTDVDPDSYSILVNLDNHIPVEWEHKDLSSPPWFMAKILKIYSVDEVTSGSTTKLPKKNYRLTVLTNAGTYGQDERIFDADGHNYENNDAMWFYILNNQGNKEYIKMFPTSRIIIEEIKLN